MPPPSPPHLLERETELETLAGLLRAARTGTGRLVVVAGPPGVGKTRLLAAVRARASGMTVLTARGH
ncbi:MAG: helix-turn-helix transcriptional regulator, partial [Solirubrobacterales bacterium]|nr:helix-turn-helix transcriptional regulator [Solirubrobacterales bacterium]